MSKGKLSSRIAPAAALLLLPVAAGTATTASSQPRPADEPSKPVEASLQPIVTEPAPSGNHRLSFGELEVAPTAIVAGAPDQAIRVKLTLTGSPGSASKLVVKLHTRGHAASPRTGRRTKSLTVRTGAIGLSGLRAGSSRSLELARLNPPPGRYRLDFFVQGEGGERRLVERAAVVVYAQHRLPPGHSVGASGLSGTAVSSDTRALVGDGANFNISDQPGDQAETYVAARPNQSSRVIAAVNPATGNPQAWISNDFMRPGTDIQRTLPSTSLRKAAEGGGTITTPLCCDPALAADRSGNLWYTVLAADDAGPDPEYIVINRIAAGTTTFRPNNVAIPRFTTGLQDKPMIGIDNTPTSPKFGMLYAVWNENSNSGQNAVISQCNTRPGGVANAANCDSPENWSEPVHVTDANGSYIYASVAAAPNGDVYVAWQDFSSDNDIEIDRCQAASNCTLAGSWGPDTDVDNLDSQGGTALPFFCPIIPAPGGRVGPQPYVDVGADGRVYVAFSDLRANGTTKCDAAPTDSTFDSFIAHGNSPNTFPAVNSGVRLSDDGALVKNDHFFPSLTVDQSTGEVQSSLYSTKGDASGQRTHQYAVRSTDGGASYGPMRRFTTEFSDYSGLTNGFDYGDYEGADSAQGRLFPVWTDNRFSQGGDAELFIHSRKLPGPNLVHEATAVNDSGGDSDGAIEPGESFTLTETVRNAGTTAATAVNGTLSTSTAGLSITQPNSPYPDIAAGATAANSNPFGASLSGAAVCGTTLNMVLDLTTAQGAFQVPVTVSTGKAGPAVARNSSDVPKSIPDNNTTGVSSTLNVATSGIIKDVNVRVSSLSHPFVGDLRIEIIGPDSTVVRLANRPGGPNNSGNNFTNTVFDDEAAIGMGGRGSAAPYTGSFRPQGDRLSRFDGKQQQGTWRLRVKDLAKLDVGTLNGWGTDTRRAVCA